MCVCVCVCVSVCVSRSQKCNQAIHSNSVYYTGS